MSKEYIIFKKQGEDLHQYTSPIPNKSVAKEYYKSLPKESFKLMVAVDTNKPSNLQGIINWCKNNING